VLTLLIHPTSFSFTSWTLFPLFHSSVIVYWEFLKLTSVRLIFLYQNANALLIYSSLNNRFTNFPKTWEPHHNYGWQKEAHVATSILSNHTYWVQAWQT
jgi:hypothetical protein